MKKKYVFLAVVILLIALPIVFLKLTIYPAPQVQGYAVELPALKQVNNTTFRLGNNWLRQNKSGDWECYVEGNAYERGLAMGILQKELIEKQEQVFVAEIEKTVPNSFYRGLLQYGIAWFNRDLDNAIPREYLDEIYGVSQSFSDKYDYIGPKLNRVLNYHAAHDIGHMVQNMNLVACSAVAQWDFESETPTMLLGRNFDFYFGDDFARNKIILFVNPEKGYDFMSVSWGGLCGVVSGMNEKGLSVTLNSLPSEIPSKSSVPVSIIAREVVQYAATIEEAFEIVKRHDVFVSESFTIVSAQDQKAAVIEKTPEATSIYYAEGNKLIVTNHFQSDALKDSELNKEHIIESESMDRFLRMQEISSVLDSALTQANVLAILRDQKGENDVDLGMGNPMAINQLLAHHSVVFNPIDRIAWISTYPFQENYFNAYNISEIAQMGSVNPLEPVFIDSLTLQPDVFYQSEEYKQFLGYKAMKKEIEAELKTNPKAEIGIQVFEKMIGLNPEYFEGYVIAGDYFHEKGDLDLAKKYYTQALSKEIPYQSYVQEINEKMNAN